MENGATREIITPLQQEEEDMHDLPEGCITQVIALTSPRDACVSAFVSKAFKVAADSDVVWGRFLLPEYSDMLLRSVPSLKLADFSSRKEIFSFLCSNSILLDGGSKSLNLEKTTGKKCVTFGAKVLGITWCGTPQYWKWRAHTESRSLSLSLQLYCSKIGDKIVHHRFGEVAELINVCWLEMTAKIESHILSTKTTYKVYLVVNHGNEAFESQQPPLDVSATFVGERDYVRGFVSNYLNHNPGQRYRRHRHNPGLSPTLKVDASPSKIENGWMEIEIGEFDIDEGEDRELQINLQKIGAWKHALLVEGVQFRPKTTYNI